MRKILLIAALLVATGCNSVPTEVVESIGVLRDNTHALSQKYDALLERSSAPDAASDAETDTEKQARLDKWIGHKQHQRLLMGANNTLADKVYEWAEVSQEDTPEENPEESE